MRGEKFPPPSSETIRSGSELYDRAEIEAEAYRLLATRDSLPEVQVQPQERRDNARTAIMEALTTSGHYSLVEISGSPQEINAQVIRRLVNGFDSRLHPHELNRRFEELCNALFIGRVEADIIRGYLPPTTVVHEESNFPSAMPQRIAESLGYRPQNRKGMSRSTHLRRNGDGSYSRVIEQVSRSNSSASHSLALLGRAAPRNERLPRDLLSLKSVMIYDARDYSDTVIDIQRRLDRSMGLGVRYGEAGGSQPAYEHLRAESLRREQQVELYIDKLAALDLKLERARQAGQITQEEYRGQYNQQVLQILRAICTLAPEYAADCFGAQAAGHYQQAALYEASGRHDLALAEIERAKPVEHSVIICGAAIADDKAKQSGLQTESASSLIEAGKESWKWKQGVCRVPKCGSPKPTEVGPCSVCRNCQKIFDQGKNPAKTWSLSQKLLSAASS